MILQLGLLEKNSLTGETGGTWSAGKRVTEKDRKQQITNKAHTTPREDGTLFSPDGESSLSKVNSYLQLLLRDRASHSF